MAGLRLFLCGLCASVFNQLSMRLSLGLALAVLVAGSWPAALAAQFRPPAAKPAAKTPDSYPGEQQDLEVARRYAPVYYQRLAGGDFSPRFDYITNFDFDGDWAGNNNWEHAADSRFPMRGYVYYAVVETETHYFVTYATYHARDWSAMQPLVGSVLDRIQQSEKYGKYLPPELRQQIELNHENDLEGAQVIVRKAVAAGPEQVEAVETLAHDEFHRSLPDDSALVSVGGHQHRLQLEQGRPLLYVEAAKHGVHSYPYEPANEKGSVLDVPDGPLLVYRYKGVAEAPEQAPAAGGGQASESVGYDLLPLYSAFWKKARPLEKPTLTFGEVHDFGDLFCRQLPPAVLARVTKNLCRLGSVGIALRGDFAGKNKALLPWGWNSPVEAQLGRGEWFLDPVKLMKVHYPEAEFSEMYLSNPFLGVFRDSRP